jgi:hypothetical protein
MNDVTITINGNDGQAVICRVPLGVAHSVLAVAHAGVGTVLIDGGEGARLAIPAEEVTSFTVRFKR